MVFRQRRAANHRGTLGILSARNLVKAIFAIFAFSALASAASAQTVARVTAPTAASAWSFGEVFTFLFVTLGPLNVIGPFLEMTQRRSASFKRLLALKSFVIAMIGLLVVAAVGPATLQAWGISTGALLLAGGAILSLVALRPVMAGYTRTANRSELFDDAVVPDPADDLAFSPLAFPTIVPPYGVALLVLLFALYPVGSAGLWILATAALVLALDLLVMLCADLIAKIPHISPGLNILGCLMNVLLIALGAQAVADGIRLLAEQTF